MRFKRLNDDQWKFIKPHPPPPAKTGRRRTNDRSTIDAILYVLKTGIPWNDLPDEYGDDVTAWMRLKRWERQGAWKRIMDALIAEGYSTGKLSMDALSVDRLMPGQFDHELFGPRYKSVPVSVKKLREIILLRLANVFLSYGWFCFEQVIITAPPPILEISFASAK